MVNTDALKVETGVLEAELKIYKLPALDLNIQQPVEDAAKRIFKECSQHLQVNFQRFSTDQNEKSLMQIRVGMRRTRVAFRIFQDIVPIETRKKFNKEFKYFGRCFGPARDLDELLFRMFGEPCANPELEIAYLELKSLTEQKRAQEYSSLCAELEEGRFASLLEAFDEWVSGDWSAGRDLNAEKLVKAEIGPFAMDVIERDQKKLLKKAASLDGRSVNELHKVRKYVKRCRYQLRFFSSLFEKNKTLQGLSILGSLQNSLGAINDESIGLALMTKFCGEVQAAHLPNCLSLIAAESLKASMGTKAHLNDVENLMRKYKEFTLAEADFGGL
ncbi:MAG: CHAD domain-containing protein [Sneathiella sp.]|nr:CHAD domain-containing protein [Sneathiella sp.]